MIGETDEMGGMPLDPIPYLVKYQIVVSNSIEDLESKVNDLIGKGWFPSGSLVSRGIVLLQTMVLYSDPGRGSS